MCSTLDGLSRVEREKEGDKSAVTKLAFVAAFLVEEGVSLDMAVGGRPDSWVISPVSKNMGKHILDRDLMYPKNTP